MKPRFSRLAPLVALGVLGGCQVVLGIESELRLAACEEGEVSNTTPADCQREVCKDGELVTEPDPDDILADVNECTEDVCEGTTPRNTPRPVDSPCGLDGLLRCDGAGKCQGCMDDMACQGGPAHPCAPITCQQGICVTNASPPGTPLPDPTPGDCMAPACGTNGVAVTVFAADPPEPPSPCIATACMEGVPQSAPRDAGAGCPGGVCDGNGTCVGCLETAHCGGGTMVCVGTTCVNYCTDGQQNHGETNLDCGGGCAGCGVGSPCVVPTDCATNDCIEGICWDPGFGG
ncbi:hypothetical protein [Polyangium mundeleinium]|uniref:Tryptophan synthase alpha chain n=1 Tax=Polyangium mundeleinium TaxID=2995306 RepID=A0ABT5EKC3_9BACT|nr:hypothetical protein [Polyangium mundeleinium]MDC0742292.1 hypothetical protein [Polyangium mundeleinium]